MKKNWHDPAYRRRYYKSRRKYPAKFWRILADNPKTGERFEMKNKGDFDELVVGDWCHLERMDYRQWCLILGDNNISIYIPTDPKKPIQIMVIEGSMVDGRLEIERRTR